MDIVNKKGKIMAEYYFFRNVENIDELIAKTNAAKLRKSLNFRKVEVTRQIIVSENEFQYITQNLLQNSKLVFDNILNMKIEKGIWKCIEVSDKKNSILIMSDGYQYPRFVALKCRSAHEEERNKVDSRSQNL